MEHEVDEPRPEEDHGRQRVGAIVIEGDIDDPRNRHADLELGSQGTDIDDDHSGCALIRPGLESEAHDTRPSRQLADRKIAAGHELRRKARGQPPPDLVDARPRAVGAIECVQPGLRRRLIGRLRRETIGWAAEERRIGFEPELREPLHPFGRRGRGGGYGRLDPPAREIDRIVKVMLGVRAARTVLRSA